MIQHPIAPVYDEASNVLILGSFPSVKSREQGFFYGHPQNRFWRVLSAVYEKPVPQTVEDKKAFLLENGVAVWDVIASCDIRFCGQQHPERTADRSGRDPGKGEDPSDLCERQEGRAALP